MRVSPHSGPRPFWRSISPQRLLSIIFQRWSHFTTYVHIAHQTRVLGQSNRLHLCLSMPIFSALTLLLVWSNRALIVGPGGGAETASCGVPVDEFPRRFLSVRRRNDSPQNLWGWTSWFAFVLVLFVHASPDTERIHPSVCLRLHACQYMCATAGTASWVTSSARRRWLLSCWATCSSWAA